MPVFPVDQYQCSACKGSFWKLTAHAPASRCPIVICNGKPELIGQTEVTMIVKENKR